MVLSIAHLSPLLSILFGILILVFPRLLNYLVAIYLILAGLLGIGLIGRPVHVRAQLDPGFVPACTAGAPSPADETAAVASPNPSSPSFGPRGPHLLRAALPSRTRRLTSTQVSVVRDGSAGVAVKTSQESVP